MYNYQYTLRFTSVCVSGDTEFHDGFAVDGHADHLVSLMKIVASGIQAGSKITISMRRIDSEDMLYAEFPSGRRLLRRFEDLVKALESNPAAQ